jgi:hypothetical protein
MNFSKYKLLQYVTLQFVIFKYKYCPITITILAYIHRPVSYLKLNVSVTGFCFRLQVEPTQLDPVDTCRADFCLRTPATTPIGFITPI